MPGAVSETVAGVAEAAVAAAVISSSVCGHFVSTCLIKRSQEYLMPLMTTLYPQESEDCHDHHCFIVRTGRAL